MLRRGVWMVFACLLCLGGAAAGAATPKRAAFDVTLTGTLTKTWAVSETVEGACDLVARTTGEWRLTLASRRPTRVVVSAPAGPRRPLRFSPGIIRSLAGTAAQGGSYEVERRGPGCERSVMHADCVRRRASFRSAKARFSSPRPGVVRFRRLQRTGAARSLRGKCAAEPAEVRSIRPELTLADAPVDAADVFDREVARFFVSGNAEQVTTLEGTVEGRVVERVRWTLTFTRRR